MSELFFEWDAKKASINAAKHGVTFEEAHCYRCGGSSIRIISARRAGTKEQQPYWEKIHAKRI